MVCSLSVAGDRDREVIRSLQHIQQQISSTGKTEPTANQHTLTHQNTARGYKKAQQENYLSQAWEVKDCASVARRQSLSIHSWPKSGRVHNTHFQERQAVDSPTTGQRQVSNQGQARHLESHPRTQQAQYRSPYHQH